MERRLGFDEFLWTEEFGLGRQKPTFDAAEVPVRDLYVTVPVKSRPRCDLCTLAESAPYGLMVFKAVDLEELGVNKLENRSIQSTKEKRLVKRIDRDVQRGSLTTAKMGRLKIQVRVLELSTASTGGHIQAALDAEDASDNRRRGNWPRSQPAQRLARRSFGECQRPFLIRFK